MSDRLTSPWGRALLVVLGFVVCGALAGVIWQAWWDPTDGLALRGAWQPIGPDLAISGTALYVVIALPLGLVLGAVASVIPRHETTTLLAVVGGSVLAAWVMYSVGHALGPPDPRPLAAGAEDLTRIPSDLVLAARDDSRNPFLSPALLALPLGSLVGLGTAYLLWPAKHPHDRAQPRSPSVVEEDTAIGG